MLRDETEMLNKWFDAQWSDTDPRGCLTNFVDLLYYLSGLDNKNRLKKGKLYFTPRDLSFFYIISYDFKSYT